MFYTGENLRAAQEQAKSASLALAQLNALLPSVAQLEESYAVISQLTEKNKRLEDRVLELEKEVKRLSSEAEERSRRSVPRRKNLVRSSSDIGDTNSRSSDGSEEQNSSPLTRSGPDVIRRMAKKYSQEKNLGVDALKKMPVHERKNSIDAETSLSSRRSSKRSGFRLLLCSDDRCKLQLVQEGIISLPHLTKTLVKLKFYAKPNLILITKRPNDEDTTRVMLEIAERLEEEGIVVLVEDTVLRQLGRFATRNMIGRAASEFHLEPVDLIVCLGGDGTIIWTSSVFPQGIPPIVSFSMGSLGFLSPFPPNKAQETLTKVLNDEALASIRSRICVQVTKYTEVNKEPIQMTYSVLNEITVDRGPSSSIVQLELYIDNNEEPITNVQGDGIIIATPTGSTAYSLASGGSMIHPAIPAMCVTPICPHSLSFRPIVIADSSYLKLLVPSTARTSAWISFDGQKRLELKQGDYLICRISAFPVTCFCSNGMYRSSCSRCEK